MGLVPDKMRQEVYDHTGDKRVVKYWFLGPRWRFPGTSRSTMQGVQTFVTTHEQRGLMLNPYMQRLLERTGEWEVKDGYRTVPIPPKISRNREQRDARDAPRPNRTRGPEATPEQTAKM